LYNILASYHLGLLHVFSRVHGAVVYTLPRGRRWTQPHLVRSLVVLIYIDDNRCRPWEERGASCTTCIMFKKRRTRAPAHQATPG
jgi:hypothetical protein